MLAYAFLTLAIATLASAGATNETMQVCWREVYTREGSIPNQCQEGYELSYGLCYKQCDANYTGVGNLCLENCPEGFIDLGAVCTNPADIYFQCPWYDICGLYAAKGCLGNCSEGYHLEACACRRPGQTITKKTYTRGPGDRPVCPSNLTESYGLCYENCKAPDFVGVGPVCWRNSSGDATYTVECNPFAFGQNKTDCEDLNKLLIQAGLTTPLCLGSLAVAICTGHIVGPKVCRDLIQQVLPSLAHTPVC